MQRPPARPVLAVAALTPLSLVLSHNLVYLLAYGDAATLVLRATGHDTAWSNAVRLVVACSGLLGAAALGRVLVLWRTARRLERATGPLAHPGWSGFAATLLRTWLALLLATSVVFLVQENIERLAAGQPAPLGGALLGGGPVGPLPVIAAISLLAALVGTLFRWSISALIERINATRKPRPRLRPARVRRPAGRLAHPSALLALHLGLRAPPAVLVV